MIKLAEAKKQIEPKLNEKYVKEINGKKFVLYSGLFDLAYQKKIESLEVKEFFVDWEKKSAYCIVTAKFVRDGETIIFEGFGSATPDNCGTMTKEHFVEMAQTRAKARALRDALNIDMCSTEELADGKAGNFGEEVPSGNKCYDCAKDVDEKVKEFSLRMYKRILCYDCQKKEKEKAAK